jgi:release factor glutamine methyltransferase
MSRPVSREALADQLSTLGFLTAGEEAGELLERAGEDPFLLEALLARRLTGEPLSWVVGSIQFCGLRVQVHTGVYEPRWQSQALCQRAIARLPDDGVAIDVCTGTGAIAVTMCVAKPNASVFATEIAERAVACAKANGVDVYQGDLFAPLPAHLLGRVDVVVGVVPYVPTAALALLPRDTFTFESTLAYDGGPAGTDLLHRVLVDAQHYLRTGGALVLELGGSQDVGVEEDLARLGYVDIAVVVDEDGDVRGIEATYERSF